MYLTNNTKFEQDELFAKICNFEFLQLSDAAVTLKCQHH